MGLDLDTLHYFDIFTKIKYIINSLGQINLSMGLGLQNRVRQCLEGGTRDKARDGFKEDSNHKDNLEFNFKLWAFNAVSPVINLL